MSISNASFNTPNDDELSLKEWPRLCWGTLPGVLSQFVELATRDSEADPVAVCFTFLVRFCSEVYGFEDNKGPRLYVGETAHPSRLFAVLCGNSSKARKGTSRYPVTRLFDRTSLLPGMLPKNLPPPASESGGPMSTGEGLAFHLQNDLGEKKLREGQDSEEAPLRDEGDKRLVIFDEEFSAALTCLKRTGNTLSMAIRNFWDNGNYNSMTKHTPVNVRNAHLNILAHITQQELAACLDQLQAVNGFANRFLWICVRRSRLISMPSQMPEKELHTLQQELWRIISLAQGLGVVTMTKSALEFWDDVYPIISKEYPDILGGLISRAEAQTLRLALVCALIDGKSQIEQRHLESACGLWEYAKNSALYIFDRWDSRSPLDEKILTILEKGSLTASALSAAFGRNIPKAQLEPTLERLQAQHRIIIRKENRGNNRPTIVISLNHLH